MGWDECGHHAETGAWTAEWTCRFCGMAWGDSLVGYFREKAIAGDHREINTAVADELDRRRGRLATPEALP